MLEVKNKKIQDIIDEMNKKEKEKIKVLKKAKGMIYLEILVPEVQAEEFEKWQLGEPLGNFGYSFLIGDSNTATSIVFLNSLERVIHEYKEKNPLAHMGNLLSCLKNNMIIDEEDDEDES